MVQFDDPERAARAQARLQALLLKPLDDWIGQAFEGCPHPDSALSHFERWLGAMGNPSSAFEHLEATPNLARLLLLVLGSSHYLADVLSQNPELGSLVLDPATLLERPVRARIESDAARLLARASSYRHGLDRLRFIKQEWSLRIAIADLAYLWPREDVWRGLSTVAEALVHATRDWAWQHFAQGEPLGRRCPLSIVAMGKLGGEELNYSSDIDLVFVADDHLNDAELRVVGRFAESLNRALSEKMGRGFLYRVDHRLRPFGTGGPLAPRMRAIESYHERYAEPWEHLALIRSAPISGEDSFAQRWWNLRERVVFQPARGEWVLEGLLALRQKSETLGDQDDLKRGPGGIRDVEFLAQILQMFGGHEHASLRARATLSALRALGDLGILSATDADTLIAAYTFLRQVEHRCQLLGQLQTHQLPKDRKEQDAIAKALHSSDGDALRRRLDEVRKSVRSIYSRITSGPLAPVHARAEVERRAEGAAEPLLRWIDSCENAAQIYTLLLENSASLSRTMRIAELFPALAGELAREPSLTELVLSGELAEEFDIEMVQARGDQQIASTIQRLRTRIGARHALFGASYGEPLSSVYEAFLKQIVEEVAPDLTVLALGSFASLRLAPYSDLDLILFGNVREAERQGRALLARIQGLRTMGSPISLDLRLRPEGRAGALVVGRAAFERYSAETMEPWERFALHRRRFVTGDPSWLDTFDAAICVTKEGEDLNSLLAIKRRVEEERVAPGDRYRNVKLGHGGIDDFEWLLELRLQWRSPATPCALPTWENRLGSLVDSGDMTPTEAGELLEDAEFLYAVRVALGLSGSQDAILPDDPVSLERLAKALGRSSRDSFEERLSGAQARVRRAFQEAIHEIQK